MITFVKSCITMFLLILTLIINTSCSSEDGVSSSSNSSDNSSSAASSSSSSSINNVFGIWSETHQGMKLGVLNPGDPLGGKIVVYGDCMFGTNPEVDLITGGDGSESLRIAIDKYKSDVYNGISFQFGCTNVSTWDKDPEQVADLSSYSTNYKIKFNIKMIAGSITNLELTIHWGNMITNYNNWGIDLRRFKNIDIVQYTNKIENNGWKSIEIPFNSDTLTDLYVGGGIDHSQIARFDFIDWYGCPYDLDFLIDNIRIEK